MRFAAAILCALLLFPLVSAYEVYTPRGIITLPELTVPVSITLGERGDLDGMLSAYSATVNSNVTAAALATARKSTIESLDRAKADDIAFIETPDRNLLLKYKECGMSMGYTFCFTAITYPEEDGPPLGDRILSTVKVVNGSYQLPATITAVRSEGKLTATRTVIPTSGFPDQEFVVTVTLKNTGTAPTDRVRIVESPTAPVLKGDLMAETASLGVNKTLSVTYTVKPIVEGNYTLSGTVTPVLTTPLLNTTITVRPYIIPQVTIGQLTAGKEAPFTLTVKNSGVDDLKLTVAVTSTDSLLGIGENWSKKGPGTLESREVSLGPTRLVNLSGMITAAGAGTNELIVTISYEGKVRREERFVISYIVQEQGLQVEPIASAAALDLTLTSDATETIQNIVVKWGDGTEETIAFLQPGRSLPLTHKYAPTTVSPVVIELAGTLSGREFTRSLTVTVPGLAAPGSLPPPAPVPSVPSVPVPSEPQTPPVVPTVTPPAEQPPTPPAAVPSEPTTEEDIGVFKRFLRWFDNLFS